MQQSPPRILLVDDDEPVGRAFARYLTVAGYQVRVETRGGGVVEAATEFGPDLILLDVILPDIDGGEVAERLAADASTRDIPLAFLTGLVSEEEVEPLATDTGGHPIIPKPVEPDHLMELIERILEAKR